jgi:DNA-binding Xre family transcriptional regulator
MLIPILKRVCHCLQGEVGDMIEVEEWAIDMRLR